MRLCAILAVALLLGACGSESVPAGAGAPTTTTAAATTTATTAVGAPALPDPRLSQAGSAGQAVVVTAGAYGATTATFTAYDRTEAGWQLAFGPWTAHIGSNGLAPPGEKREADGRTPSGVYGFSFMFGVDSDPGVRFPYRLIPDHSIVWDDDPASPRYNEWVDRDDADPGHDPEAMYQPVAYQHGVVIAYNPDHTPGAGSAIFLHTSTGGPTAGCVSLPHSQLVEVLRWLDPAKSPSIVMGVG